MNVPVIALVNQNDEFVIHERGVKLTLCPLKRLNQTEPLSCFRTNLTSSRFLFLIVESFRRNCSWVPNRMENYDPNTLGECKSSLLLLLPLLF